MFWLGEIFLSIYILMGSAIITFIAAIISSFKSKHIWCSVAYLQAALQLILALCYYVDGAHYPPAIDRTLTILCCISIVAAVPFILHKIELKRKFFLVIMWVFSLAMPLFVGYTTLIILTDPRPYSEETLENFLGVNLPKYKVTKIEAFSPGGDDWEEHALIKIDPKADLTCFIEDLDAKCKFCEERIITNYDERWEEGYIECNKTGSGYKFLYRFHIEASITFDINLEERTIAYRYLKI